MTNKKISPNQLEIGKIYVLPKWNESFLFLGWKFENVSKKYGWISCLTKDGITEWYIVLTDLFIELS